MCLSPVLIKNTNANILSKNTKFSDLYDTTTQYIQVPCGRCPVCVALRQQYIVQRVQMESLDNLIVFGTLTYNKATLPTLDVNGYPIKYADVRHFQDMIRLIRKNKLLPDFRYMAVSEFGGKKHRPHWHFMLFYPKSAIVDDYRKLNSWHLDALQGQLWPIFLKYWRHNNGSRKFPDWQPNCDFHQTKYLRNYDLQIVDTISHDCSDSAFYVTKYSTKSSDYVDRLKSAIRLNTSENEFKEIWQKIKPRFLFSKGFGNYHSPLVVDHIRKGIEYSLRDPECFYPHFISPYTGQHYPLSPYYREKFITADEDIIFKERVLAHSSTGVISDADIGIPMTSYEIEQKFYFHEKQKGMINQRDSYYSDCIDILSKDNNDLTNFLKTDKDYGIIQKPSAEDFTASDYWEDSELDNNNDCSDNLSILF